MPGKPIYVDLPQRDASLALPSLRDIVLATLAAEGYGELATHPVRYQPELGWEGGISVKLTAPFEGRVVGEWVSGERARLEFSVPELMVVMQGGVIPFTSPRTLVPPYTVFRIGFNAPPPIPPTPLEEQPVPEIMPRERTIMLDDM